jgi:hypothetical protein
MTKQSSWNSPFQDELIDNKIDLFDLNMADQNLSLLSFFMMTFSLPSQFPKP